MNIITQTNELYKTTTLFLFQNIDVTYCTSVRNIFEIIKISARLNL